MKVCLLSLVACLTTGCPSAPSELTDFPCDFEARCPGRLGCDLAKGVCVAMANCSGTQTECEGVCVALAPASS